MAEENSNDGRDSLNILDMVPEAALIYGLTRAQQDSLIRDQLRKKVIGPAERMLEEKNSGKKVENIDNLRRNVNLSKLLDNTHELVRNLPEEWQDSWVLSLLDGNEAGFEDMDVTGSYNPNREMVKFKFGEYPKPRSILHEYEHKNGHDVNLYDQAFRERRLHPGYVPIVFAEKNLGEKIQKDFSKGVFSRLPLSGRFYSKYLNPENDKERFRKAVSDFAESKGGIKEGFSKDGYYFDAGYDLADIAALDPNYVMSGVDIGHGEKYKKIQSANADRLATRDEGLLGTFPYDVRANFAQSIETPAELAEIVGDRNNSIDVPKVFEETYKDIVDTYANDPRKSIIRDYGVDFGQKAYSLMGDVPEVDYDARFLPEKDIYGVMRYKDGYYRVPSVYGGYNYLGKNSDEYDARRTALHNGLNHFEYRAPDGSWQKYHPSDMGRISRKMEPINFDNYFSYYVDVGGGKRKGFNNKEDLGSYLVANPEIGKFYENTPVLDSAGNVVRNEYGEKKMEWKPKDNDGRVPYIDNYRKLGNEFPEKVKKFVDERNLLKNIIEEKDAAKAFKTMIKYLR